MRAPRDARALHGAAPILLALALCAPAAGCGDDGRPELVDSGTESPLRLRDATAASGIDFATTSGRQPSSQILEVKGGGLALLDLEGDGDLDLLVPNGATLDSPGRGPGARLFRNEGGLRFTDVTGETGLDFHRWAYGACVGDVDGDGLDDVFLACYGRDALLRNAGGRLVEDVSSGAAADERWSTSAAFGDLDGDGDLDLYVTRYLVFDVEDPPPPMNFLGVEVFGGPMGVPAAADSVYENDGAGGFREVTAEWGFDAVAPSYGLGATILDLDGDATPEVLVGNDSEANFLFRLAPGEEVRYVDVGVASGIALSEEGWGQATMGIAVGDVDGDGLPDVFTTNFMADVNTLHLNLGDLRFEDRTRAYGLALESRPFLGWSTAFVDLDHDADEDLLVVNGHVYPDTITEPQGWRRLQEPLLFERVGERFRRVRGDVAGAWLEEPHQDRGAAFGDLDRDGDVDVVVSELGGPVRVLENVGAPGAWLVVELADRRAGSGNPRGLGARVELLAGGVTQVRWVASGLSYQSSSWSAAHFGLGAHEGAVELVVRWPDGVEQRVEVPSARRYVTVERVE